MTFLILKHKKQLVGYFNKTHKKYSQNLENPFLRFEKMKIFDFNFES